VIELTPATTPAGGVELFEATDRVRSGTGSDVSIPLHSVWGRVVPDNPAFCRELVAALAEQ
jgi:hypothetical protein